MKSISTELVNEYKKLLQHTKNTGNSTYNSRQTILQKAKQHAETSKEIINLLFGLSKEYHNRTETCGICEITEYYENEIKILKDGGLI